MTILVTDAAGFIGFHVSAALLKRGEQVLGVGNLNEDYDVTLKEAQKPGLLRMPRGAPRPRPSLPSVSGPDDCTAIAVPEPTRSKHGIA